MPVGMRWLALVTLLCAARIGHADPGVGVVAYGDPSMNAAVATRFERWLRKNGHTVIDAPMSVDAINTLSNCFTLDDLVCARGVFDARAKADALVFIGIGVADKNITFNVYWFVKGKDPVGERRACEKCDTPRWHELADKMLERLTGETKVKTVVIDNGGGSRLLPGATIVVGAAMLAGSAIAFYYGSLDSPNQKWIYPTATPIGIGLSTVGLGTVAVGTFWLFQSGSSGSHPVGAATRDGGYLGWAGRF
jgi:hypothetical protein